MEEEEFCDFKCCKTDQTVRFTMLKMAENPKQEIKSGFFCKIPSVKIESLQPPPTSWHSTLMF